MPGAEQGRRGLALLIAVDPLPKLFSRFEVWHMLARQRDWLTGFRIATNAGRAMVEGKTAETTNLDALAGGQGLAHMLEKGLDRQLNVPIHEMLLFHGDQLDQLGFRHRPERPEECRWVSDSMPVSERGAGNGPDGKPARTAVE